MSDLELAEVRSIDQKPYDELSKLEKRALWESFAFAVPAAGLVCIENKSYGEESNRHLYIVTVEDGAPDECTCTFAQRTDTCKHQIAVTNEPAILHAASQPQEKFEEVREGRPRARETRFEFCPRCGRSLPGTGRIVIRCPTCALLISTAKLPKDMREAESEPITDLESEIGSALAEVAQR
jgi:hypothetical protein